MGRLRVDELDNNPVGGSDLGKLRQEAEAFAEELQTLADDDRYAFAWGTLTDMRLTVQQTERVTEGQRNAVRNIVEGAKEGQRSRARHQRSRRYEGWGR